ncbi:hypothetical protein [Pedobacter africanus]|uniref:Uncharacterized protein n=1 Tax=Pedobacter africanus TaxID=151894 RepID=A0A1W1ZD49_9SPHI|nr:hypothetical protein [Pedobacter africanus]SMC45948.1 hypothetical protein SAMN04488524_0582 [Pedobacter africanus]
MKDQPFKQLTAYTNNTPVVASGNSQMPHTPTGEVMTVNDAKETIARQYNYNSWSEFYHQMIGGNVRVAFISKMYDESHYLHTQQFKARAEAADQRVKELEQQEIDLKIAGQKLHGCLQNINSHVELPDYYNDWIRNVLNETDEILSDDEGGNTERTKP